ncbi:MAG: redoxin domain-containing protein [Saprospiraceae bacterium]|nr:redoxin domain-containing protein [Saprospiraceae bacterium]
MKLISIFSFLFVLTFNLKSFSQQDSCHLKFEVKGETAGKVKLIGVFADQNYIADSTMIDADGKFEFKRKSPMKPGYFYVILPDYTNFHVMIDKEQHFSMRTTKSDLINNMKVEGSLDNLLLYEALRLQMIHDKKIDSVNQFKKLHEAEPTTQKYVEDAFQKINDERKAQVKSFVEKYPQAFFTKFKSAGQNPDLVEVLDEKGQVDRAAQLQYFKAQFWDNVDMSDSRLIYTPVIVNKLNKYIVDFTVQHPDSIIKYADKIIQKSLANREMFQFVSNWIALKYQPTKTKVMDGEAVYVHIINKYFTKENAYWLDTAELGKLRKKAWEMESSLLNKKGPDVISVDPNGQTKSIYEIKKPYVIVFMFDPKCDHCREETPKLRKFYQEWKDKVEVFAIAMQTNDKEWKEFLDKYQIRDWTNVYDPTNRSIYAKYWVDITPEMYVLDKNRKIIGKNLKTDQLSIILNKDLGIQE